MPTAAQRVVFHDAQVVRGCLNGDPVLVEFEKDDCGRLAAEPSRLFSFQGGGLVALDTQNWDQAQWAEVDLKECPAAGQICRYTAQIPDSATAISDSNGVSGSTVAEYLDALGDCLVESKSVEPGSTANTFSLDGLGNVASSPVAFDGGQLIHSGNGDFGTETVGGTLFVRQKATSGTNTLTYQFDDPVSSFETRFYDLENQEFLRVSASLDGAALPAADLSFDPSPSVSPQGDEWTGTTFTSTPDTDEPRSLGLSIPGPVDTVVIEMRETAPTGRNVLHAAPTWLASTTITVTEVTQSCAATSVSYTGADGDAQTAQYTEVCKSCCEWLLDRPAHQGRPECQTVYSTLAEGSSTTVPAGSRALAVMTPCDGSAHCTGVPGGPVVTGGGLVIAESESSVLGEDVTISAARGTTVVSWMECD